MNSLTDQIRRSSRSVTIIISEAYRKREYLKHFHSKLTDADSETQGWLEYALVCKYISDDKFTELTNNSIEIGRLINYMILNPEKFDVKKQ